MGKNKKVMLGILACTCLVSIVWAGTPPSAQQKPAPSLPSRISPKAQELLNHAIQALGGPAFLNFKNVYTTGRAYAFSYGQMAGLEPFKSTYEPPDKRRFSYGKSKPVILINNGDKAWELDQYGRTSQLPKQVQAWKIANRFGLDNLFRTLIKQKGVLILDHGVDFVANRPAYVIEIFDAQNDRIQLYLRHSNYLPLRVTYRLQNTREDDWDEYVDDYSDYQQFDGIMTPMSVVRTLNGERIGAIYRNNVRYNQDVPANYFEPPR
ncbi:MAG: hypothetical protein P8Z30_06985 [Acidobacteriota bacterium]